GVRLIVLSVAAASTVPLTACWSVLGGDLAPVPAVSDFYVDPQGETSESRFRTITSALAAANASKAPTRTIHVAAGMYGAVTGGTFPLEVRGGISIEGAGIGATILQGTGLVSVSAPAISTAVVRATILVGETAKTSRIADLSLVSDGPSTPAAYEGIVCD